MSLSGPTPKQEALIRAIEEDNEPIVIELLKGTMDLNFLGTAQGGYKVSPLQLAVAIGNENVIDAIIEKGVLIDSQNEQGFTALHIAAMNLKENIIEKLYQRGANITIKNSNGETALHLALNAHKELNAAAVIKIIDLGADINEQNGDQDTPLHLAIKNPNHEIVSKLLDQPEINLDVKDKEGNPPLYVAIRSGQEPIADLILKKSPKINLQNNEGDTALHLALAQKNEELVRLLLEAGADIHIKNSKGQSALDIAKARESTSTMSPVFKLVIDAEIKQLEDNAWYHQNHIKDILKIRRIFGNEREHPYNSGLNMNEDFFKHDTNTIFAFLGATKLASDKAFKEAIEQDLAELFKYCPKDGGKKSSFACSMRIGHDHHVPVIFNTDGEILIGRSINTPRYQRYNETIVTAIKSEMKKKGITPEKISYLDATQSDTSSCGPITAEVLSEYDPNRSIYAQKDRLNKVAENVDKNPTEYRKKQIGAYQKAQKLNAVDLSKGYLKERNNTPENEAKYKKSLEEIENFRKSQTFSVKRFSDNLSSSIKDLESLVQINKPPDLTVELEEQNLEPLFDLAVQEPPELTPSTEHLLTMRKGKAPEASDTTDTLFSMSSPGFSPSMTAKKVRKPSERSFEDPLLTPEQMSDYKAIFGNEDPYIVLAKIIKHQNEVVSSMLEGKTANFQKRLKSIIPAVQFCVQGAREEWRQAEADRTANRKPPNEIAALKAKMETFEHIQNMMLSLKSLTKNKSQYTQEYLALRLEELQNQLNKQGVDQDVQEFMDEALKDVIEKNTFNKRHFYQSDKLGMGSTPFDASQETMKLGDIKKRVKIEHANKGQDVSATFSYNRKKMLGKTSKKIWSNRKEEYNRFRRQIQDLANVSVSEYNKGSPGNPINIRYIGPPQPEVAIMLLMEYKKRAIMEGKPFHAKNAPGKSPPEIVITASTDFTKDERDYFMHFAMQKPQLAKGEKLKATEGCAGYKVFKMGVEMEKSDKPEDIQEGMDRFLDSMLGKSRAKLNASLTSVGSSLKDVAANDSWKDNSASKPAQFKA